MNLIEYQKPTIQTLFSNRAYKIPKYQRPFSWNVDKAEKFWDDIFNELEDYFLGTIVLNGENGNFEVIDGQQRITTISLFFLALYLFYKKNIDAGEARTHIYKYLKTGNLRDEYRILTLSKNNDEFYNKILKIDSVENLSHLCPENNSNKNILSIVNKFLEKFESDSVEDKNLEKNRLVEILEKFEKKVFFIEINVPDYKQASKLFEVLNNRGTDLTKSDLVRNYLLSMAEEQQYVDAYKVWRDVENNVGIDNLEKFFRYSSLLMSLNDDLYERIIEKTERSSAKVSIDLLYKLSLVYKKILDPSSYAENEKEVGLLEELKILNVTQSHSILLAGYFKFSSEEILKLIRYVVNFTFRYSTICGKNPNKLEKQYADIAYKIFNNNLNFDEIKEELVDLNPTDVTFDESFKLREFKSTKLPRYILSKIENFISSEEKNLDQASVHLEHIMPKKIDKWIEKDRIYLDIYSKYIDNIGNMTLLSKKINTSIKNSLFKIKKESYGDSEINIIADIKNKNKWFEEEIIWNLNRYLNYSKEIWKI